MMCTVQLFLIFIRIYKICQNYAIAISFVKIQSNLAVIMFCNSRPKVCCSTD